MLKVNFFHICDTAMFENSTGKLSIVGVFENVNAEQFPAVQPSMAFVVGFESDKAGEYDVDLQIVDETENILKTQAKITIGPNLRGNWVHKLAMYTIPKEATHKIILSQGGEVIYTTFLTINNK